MYGDNWLRTVEQLTYQPSLKKILYIYSILGKHEPQIAMNFKIWWVNGYCSIQNWCVGYICI